MFSSDELLHFVFANENDTYYSNGPLALNLEQLLWLKLHEQHYGCVYFLRFSEDGCSVASFGDRMGQPFTETPVKRRLFGQKPSSAIQDWLLKQLWAGGQRRAAVVCSMHDLCACCADAQWQSFFKRLNTPGRQGILVLTAPLEAELSRDALLSSPVFDALHDTPVAGLRRARLCPLYSTLKEYAPERMQFLNIPTRQRLSRLLGRLMLESPARMEAQPQRETMAAILQQWLTNAPLRAARPQLVRFLPQPGASWRTLHDALAKKPSWDALTQAAEEVQHQGGLEAWLKALGCTPVPEQPDAVGIRRQPDSVAGRCLRLRLPANPPGHEEEFAAAAALLQKIKHELREPKNRPENDNLSRAMDRFLSDLLVDASSGDGGTVYRLLYAVDFCVHWLHVVPGSRNEAMILELLRLLQKYVAYSRQCFMRQENLRIELANRRRGEHAMTEAAIENLQRQVDGEQKALKRWDDLVRAKEVQMLLAPSESSIAELANNITDLLASLESEAKDTADNSAVQKADAPHSEASEEASSKEAAAQTPSEDTYEYDLRAEDYSYTPLPHGQR